jgi:hypothetical protein
MDTTQPMTAADFVSVGVDPATAASLAAQHEALAGRSGFNARVEAAQSLVNLPPPPAAAPAPTTTNAQLADATAAHENAQLVGTLDAAFAPPAQPYDYQFPQTTDTLTDEQLASDSALKTALHAAQMPKFVVESIAQNLAEASRTLANETPAQAQLRIGSQKSRLEGMWGKDNFDGNLQIVDTFLEAAGAKSPVLKAFLESAARAFTPLDLDLILQVAKHRAGRA